MIGILYALAIMLGVPGILLSAFNAEFTDNHFAGFALTLAAGFLATLAWLGSKLA